MADKTRFYDLVRSVPKAELHIHLEDFIAGESAREERVTSLEEFINLYYTLLDSLRAIEDLDVAFVNLASYLWENGVVYAEVFFSPSRYVRNKGFRYSDLVKFFEKKVKQIKAERGITIRLMPDVSRSYGPELADKLLDIILSKRSKYIIGIGLGGPEHLSKNREYKDVFEKARKHGLRTVAHAGESVGPSCIHDAIEILGAERIGHATSAFQDEKVIQLLVTKQIPVEIAITSNLITGQYVKELTEHPVKHYLARGVFVTVGTDDPNLFKTTLLDEYWKIYSSFGCGLRTVYQIIKNSFLASFLSDGQKHRYVKRVNRSWNRKFLIDNKSSSSADWQKSIIQNFKGRD